MKWFKDPERSCYRIYWSIWSYFIQDFHLCVVVTVWLQLPHPFALWFVLAEVSLDSEAALRGQAPEVSHQPPRAGGDEPGGDDRGDQLTPEPAHGVNKLDGVGQGLLCHLAAGNKNLHSAWSLSDLTSMFLDCSCPCWLSPQRLSGPSCCRCPPAGRWCPCGWLQSTRQWWSRSLRSNEHIWNWRHWIDPKNEVVSLTSNTPLSPSCPPWARSRWGRCMSAASPGGSVPSRSQRWGTARRECACQSDLAPTLRQ